MTRGKIIFDYLCNGYTRKEAEANAERIFNDHLGRIGADSSLSRIMGMDWVFDSRALRKGTGQ